MKKEPNYVNCPWCAQESPRKQCSLCKGTGKVRDPAEQLCNLCGGRLCHKIKTESGLWDTDAPSGLIDAKVVGGYESYHLFDMSQYTFSFCEECLRKLFIQCKIKPQINNLQFPQIIDENSSYEEGEDISWKDDQTSYEYRVWRDYGGHHQAYLDRKCNAKKDCPNQAIYTRLRDQEEFTEDCYCEEHKILNTYFDSKLTKFIPQILKPFL